MTMMDEFVRRLLLKPNTWDRIEKFSIPEPNSGCTLWLGALSKGYAVMSSTVIDGKQMSIRVARLILARKLDKIPLWALHTCDLRCCINEDHLYEGHRSENSQDMADRPQRHRHNGFT